MAAVHRTRSEHDAAKAQYDMLMNVRRDLGLAHPDGIAALRKAMHIYDDARRRHEAALMALSEFVLGK